MVIKDQTQKDYSYLSRYASIPTFYNDEDKKRYYGTSKQLREATSYILHKVLKNETLDIISLRYYNTPLYWWIIADINKIRDPFELTEGTMLKIIDLKEVVFE